MSIELNELPDPARAAWASLRDEVRTILGDELVAMWAHGGSTSVGDPAHAGDLDTHVLVSAPPDEATARRLADAGARVERQHGVELDTWFVRADDAQGADPPRHAWLENRRDTSWALHRAHWLAGRYVGLHGPEPAAIVKPPTWQELEPELDRELEHIERHVHEGDTDPYEAAYAILNGSRILYSLNTRNVVISKRAAGGWGLEHLPARWHPVIEAGIRSYHGEATDNDIVLLAEEMAPFVAFVRERLPYADDRPPDAPPRWSGY